VREAIRNFVPVVAARGAVNLSAYLDYFLAAFLATGAVAVLGYAQTLYILPISLFALSVAASELPELAGARHATERLRVDVGKGVERVIYFLAPTTIAYLVVGDVIIAALLQRGQFGPDDVRATWIVLAAYTLGISASAVSRLLSSAFYAVRDTRTPARLAYVRVGLSTAVGLLLMFPFDAWSVGGLRLGAAGLAIGASVGAWAEWFFLRRALQKHIGPVRASGSRIGRILGAAAAAGAVGFAARHILLPFHPWIQAPGTLIPFGGVYLAITATLGVSDPVRSLLAGRSDKP
jgi:putative peptidoglycan lipid II flippase